MPTATPNAVEREFAETVANEESADCLNLAPRWPDMRLGGGPSIKLAEHEKEARTKSNSIFCYTYCFSSQETPV